MSSVLRFLLIVLVLASGVGAVVALESRALLRLDRAPDASAAEAVATAEAVVARHVEAAVHDLRRRARELAADPAVRAALRDSVSAHRALSRFRALRLPEHVAAELYTPEPRLVAWSGPALPLDPATRRLDFLSRPQTAIVSDDGVREAVVVWEPVIEGGRTLGGVRVARVVRASVPVVNQFLRDYDATVPWTRGLVAPVAVRFGESAGAFGGIEVRGDDGALLAHVEAIPPAPVELERSVRERYGNARTFLLVLLLGWIVSGGALWAVSAARRSLLAPSGRAAWEAVAAAGVLGVGLWATRYALIFLGWPVRMVGREAMPSAFDPALLGSGLGGGLAGSPADFMLTALTAAATGALALAGALTVARFRLVRARLEGPSRTSVGWWVRAVVGVGLGMVLVGLSALLIHRATVDATLGFLVRTELLPEWTIPPTLGAFLLVALGGATALVALLLWVGLRDGLRLPAVLAVATIAGGAAYGWTPLGTVMPWTVAVGFFGVALSAAWRLEREPDAWSRALSLRGSFVLVLVVAALAYPIVFSAQRDRDDARLREAAADFADGEDPRVAFALESALLDARAAPALGSALDDPRSSPFVLDSLAADLVAGSLLNALADYRVSLTLHTPSGRTIGRYREDAPQRFEGEAGGTGGSASFSRLRRAYDDEIGLAGVLVERRPAGGPGGRFRFEGIAPLRDGPELLGWVTARADPQPARYVAETPFPRVLIPAGLYRIAEEEAAFAEFTGGVLTRTRGTEFGRFRLPEAVAALPVGASVWRTEPAEGQPTRTLYRRVSPERVVAVRVPAPTVFDHLYFLLRLLLPGFALVGVLAVTGGLLRRRLGAPPPRLRDRILSRFLLVGLLAVGSTGMIGRTVIVTQNREAVEDLLKRRLARVEAVLYEEVASPGEILTPERFLNRARPELIGPRLGLDVALYREGELVASSRSQLVRQRLIEPRLPVEVAEALFVEGRRYAFATERVGRFRYTTGYEAIPDSEGRPAVVLGVPTLSEQLAIETDQARMLAYLFGVLLLLLGLIFGLATVLADRLARPFRRLREGLRAVGAGETPDEPIPVESRDEVGEVIETFNAVRDQLEASRRQLAAQERELAWREMARQVAHEIKNPLTPMKLSVQHLQRAHARHGTDDERFPGLLERITHTIIEQIDALSRIAGEFSRFARLPESHLEPLDLNTVLRQAAALLSEEPRARVVQALADEPLPVLADREELRRVYINLLKNAQQAIPEGERGTITVRSERYTDKGGREWARSAVRDTGAGIPEDVRERIFTPNFSTKTSGMGLGLAIARKAVEHLGGSISFETEPGRGTVFFVELPLQANEESAARLDAEAGES